MGGRVVQRGDQGAIRRDIQISWGFQERGGGAGVAG